MPARDWVRPIGCRSGCWVSISRRTACRTADRDQASDPSSRAASRGEWASVASRVRNTSGQRPRGAMVGLVRGSRDREPGWGDHHQRHAAGQVFPLRSPRQAPRSRPLGHRCQAAFVGRQTGGAVSLGGRSSSSRLESVELGKRASPETSRKMGDRRGRLLRRDRAWYAREG